jgi:hypothetical protein
VNSRFSCCTMLVVLLGLSALAFAGSNETAVLRSSGPVAVNGSAAPTTTALFRGDNVQTANGGVVTISSPGSTVLIPANSKMIFNGGVLDLTVGSASINTTKGLSAKIDKYAISPASSGTAKYEIQRSGNSVLIHSTSGVLNVSAPGNTFTLAQGATAALNSGAEAYSTTSHPLPPTISGSQPTTSFFSVEGALSDPGPNALPWCPNVNLCVIGPSVSGHKPCRCRAL